MYKGFTSLPIKKLKSVNVPVTKLYWLPNDTLEELDIRGTLIEKLDAIDKFPYLKTLILSPGFPPEELKKVPEHVKLIILE